MKSIDRNVSIAHVCSVRCGGANLSVTTTSAPGQGQSTIATTTYTSVSTTTISTTTTTTSSITTTTNSSWSRLYCESPNDCFRGNITTYFTLASNCTTTSSVFCDYDTHDHIHLVNTDGSNIHTLHGSLLHNSTTCTIQRPEGTILDIKGPRQSNGTLLNIDASDLVDGSGIHISNRNGNLNTGSLLKLTTTSTTPINGLIQIDSNSVSKDKSSRSVLTT